MPIDYEAILEAEGMPAEIRSLFRGGSGCGDPETAVAFYQFFDGDPSKSERKSSDSVSSLPVFEYWQSFQEIVWAVLGLTDAERDCMIAYSEHGFLSRACREYGVTYVRGLALVRKVKAKM